MRKPKAVILCIDDATIALEASKELLEISGYEVLTAQSGKEGAFGLPNARDEWISCGEPDEES